MTKKRRSLTDGLKSKKPDQKTEAAFISGNAGTKPTHQDKPAPTEATAAPPNARNAVQETPTPQPHGRSPLTTRLRTDLADALKRASLERQLSKVTPNTVQDILEEALEPWLRRNGYLKD